MITVVLIGTIVGLLAIPKVQRSLQLVAIHSISNFLHTPVTVSKISYAFFNKLDIEGILIKDRNKDTLLFISNLYVNLSDWFLLNQYPQLNTLSIDGLYYREYRKDSIWNFSLINKDTQTFIKDTIKSTLPAFQLAITNFSITNLFYTRKDMWRGEDISVKIADCELTAFNIDSQYRIKDMILLNPELIIREYTGLRKDTLTAALSHEKDKRPFFNPNLLVLNISKSHIVDGKINIDLQGSLDTSMPFDPYHIHMTKINTEISNLVMNDKLIEGRVASLRVQEQSGLSIQRMKTNFRMTSHIMEFADLDLYTPKSHVTDYYAMKYKSFFNDFDNYIDSVSMVIHAKPTSYIHTDDIAYFTRALATIHDSINVSGNATGIVRQFKITNLFANALQTSIHGNISLVGLPDMANTILETDTIDAQTSYANLLLLYPPVSRYIASPQLGSLELMKFNGVVSGDPKLVHVNGSLLTALGALFVDMQLNINGKDSMQYSGKINAPDFQIGAFLDNNKINHVSANGVIKGTIVNNQFQSIGFSGSVDSFNFNKYTYKAIVLDGIFQKTIFQGKINSQDTNFNCNLNTTINWHDSLPHIQAIGRIENLNLKNINFLDSDIIIKGIVNADIIGNNINNIEGTITASDVLISKDEKPLTFTSIQLASHFDAPLERSIDITSDQFSVSLSGNFNFFNIKSDFIKIIHQYYPFIVELSKADSLNSLNPASYRFHIVTNHVKKLLQYFNSKIGGLDSMDVSGYMNINSDGSTNLEASGTIPMIQYNKIKYTNLNFSIDTKLDSLKLKLKLGSISFDKRKKILNISGALASSPTTIKVDLYSSGVKSLNNLDLHFLADLEKNGMKLAILPSFFQINNEQWQIKQKKEITLQNRRLTIPAIHLVHGRDDDIVIYTKDEVESINKQEICIDVLKVNINFLSNYLLFDDDLLQGNLIGYMRVSNIFEKPSAKAFFYINSLQLADYKLGSLILKAHYSAETKKTLYQISLPDSRIEGNGAYSSNSKETVQNSVVFTFQKTPFNFLSPLLRGIFTTISSTATGTIAITNYYGNKSASIDGNLKALNTHTIIDYTQVSYIIDTLYIHMDHDAIRFDEFTLKDKFNNTGKASGTINVSDWNDPYFNFNIQSPRIQLLDTKIEDNEQFYGTAFGQASFSMIGPISKLLLQIQAIGNQPSHITILNNSIKDSLVDNDYIFFKKYGQVIKPKVKPINNNLTVEMDMVITNKIVFNIVIDQRTGDSITTTGNGKIKMLFNSDNPFDLVGRYYIENGQYDFSFQSLYRKSFYIVPDINNYVEWNGNPLDGTMRVEAKYIAHDIKLENLLPPDYQQGTFDNVRGYKGDVYIICNMTGSIASPNLKFKFQFPNNAQLQNDFGLQQILANIQNNETDLQKQVTFIIFFNSFVPYQGDASSTINPGQVGLNTLSNFLTQGLNQLFDDLFSRIFKDKNSKLEFNSSIYNTTLSSYSTTPGNTNSSNNANGLGYARSAFDLKYIQKLMKDRIEIKVGSAIDFAVNSVQLTNSQSGLLFLPDIRVEFILNKNKKLRLTTFYTDNIDLTTVNGKRNQTGVSLSYRTDFDSLSLKKLLAPKIKKKGSMTK